MREKLTHILVIVGVGTIFYMNSFANFFVWNDWTLIIENFLIKDWWNLPEIFTSAFWKPLVGEPAQIYRPLVFISFMADFSLWGLNAWGYHLTNTSLHVLNSVLVYSLMRVYVSPTIALMTSALFSAHPIHTEAVTYIAGRGELLMSLFLLSGTLLFLQSEKRSSRSLYLACLPLFFFALLAKETAVIFPLLLIVADVTAFSFSWHSHPLRRFAHLLGPLVALGLYFVLRKIFVGMSSSGYSFDASDFVHPLLIVLKAIPVYLGLLLFPLNLHFLHPLSPFPLDLQLLVAILLLMGIGGGLYRAFRSGNQPVTFALLWFLIGLLPLVYFSAWNLPLLEGWIYLPSLGFFLLVAFGLSQLRFFGPSRLHIWLTLLIAVLLGGVTLNRNQDWKDDMQISLHTIAASPDDPVALRLLGNVHFKRGRTDEAEKMFKRALLLAPGDPRLHESLGRFFSFIGRDAQTLEHYSSVLELTPKEPYPYWLLGRYYRRKGEWAESAKYFAHAIRLFPYSSELHNNLALVYFQQGKFDAALAELQAALKISPFSPILQDNIKEVLGKKER